MQTVFAAAATVTRDSLAMLADVLEGLPDGALDWTPVSGTNSLAVLSVHSLTSLEFWLCAGAGARPSRPEYLERRAEAFRVRGLTGAQLRARLASTTVIVTRALEGAEDDALTTALPWTGEEGGLISGAECLFRAIGHLREHVGQAQVVRDLWMAASREGR